MFYINDKLNDNWNMMRKIYDKKQRKSKDPR